MSLVNRRLCAAVFSTVETHCAFMKWAKGYKAQTNPGDMDYCPSALLSLLTTLSHEKHAQAVIKNSDPKA